MTGRQYRHSIFPDQPFGSLPDEQEDWQWEQIHFYFGQAMLRAQAYEDAVARFVIAAEQRWKRSGKHAGEIKKMPLGRLQQEYKRYCAFQPHHLEEMEVARSLRNSLAHNFYRRRINLLSSVVGRERVIKELHGAVRLFRHLRDDAYWNLSLLTGETPL